MSDPRKAFETKLVELARQDKRIVAVSCDSCSGGGLSAFFKEFPERSIEVGISEQNAVSLCAAMARQGLLPVLVIINPFLTMRAYEQIRDDLGYMNTKVVIVGSGGGLAYSTLGSTHIAVEDVGLMRSVPHLTILAPGDADEVEFSLEQALAADGPVSIRMPRQSRNAPVEGKRTLVLGKAEVLSEGSDAALYTYGPSAEEAMKACRLLEGQGISLSVLNFTTVKPLDAEAVLAHAKGKKAVFTLEEHAPVGGIGSAVAEVLAQAGAGVPLHVLAVPEGAKNTGPYPELLDYYGLSGAEAAKRIAAVLHDCEK